jgi:hypothetical protein
MVGSLEGSLVEGRVHHDPNAVIDHVIDEVADEPFRQADGLVEAEGPVVHEPFRDLLPVGGLAPEPEGLGEEAQVIVADDASDGFLCH